MKKIKKIKIICLMFVLVMFVLGGSINAKIVTLSWEAPTTNADGTPLTDLGGFVVHYGLLSRVYDWYADAGNITTYQLQVDDHVDYYFTVTAYNTSGNQSGFSNEVMSPSIRDYTFYCDDDLDGFVSSYPSGYCDGTGCIPIECQATPGTDCDDVYNTVNPAEADDDCNGYDDNCDGTPDNNYQAMQVACGCDSGGVTECSNGTETDTCAPGAEQDVCDYYCDEDLDGYYSATPNGFCNGVNCIPFSCQSTQGTDCNDNNSVTSCSYVYVQHRATRDLNANGSADMAVLRNDSITNRPTVKIIDSTTGATINQLAYSHAHSESMDLVSYTDGNGVTKIGVLFYDHDIGQTGFEIKDALSTETINLEAHTGLTISNVSDTQVVLSWNDVNNALSYSIYRDGMYVGTSSTSSFIDGNVVGGTNYSYTIYAINGSNSSVSSEELIVEACYYPARIPGSPAIYYATLQEAYNAVTDGGRIQVRAQTPNQNLDANINKTVTLDSGYNCDYSATTCDAEFNGNVAINNGMVLIECSPDVPVSYIKHVPYIDTDGSIKFAVVVSKNNESHVYILNDQGVIEKDNVYFTSNYTPLDVTKHVVGSETFIGVLSNKDSDDSRVFESRDANGTLY